MNIREIVGGNIRCLRKKSKMSLEALPFETGLNHDYIGRVERGLQSISTDNIFKIAIALQTPPHTLLIENWCAEHLIMADGHANEVDVKDKNPRRNPQSYTPLFTTLNKCVNYVTNFIYYVTNLCGRSRIFAD